MVRELPLEPCERELIDGVPEVLDGSIEGIPLSTVNVTAGLSLGLLMGALGDACIRQVLNPALGGPLGPKPERERG